MIRRSGLISMLALTSYLFCGFSQPTECKSSGQIGPSTGEIVAGSVAIGAVVGAAIAIPVVISHNHHTLKGCVFTGQNGLGVESADGLKTFSVTGVTDGIRVGELVKLHGSRQKKQKGVEQTFLIEKVDKDYGPCKIPAATQAVSQARP